MKMILWMLAVLVGYFIKGVAGFGNTLVVTGAMAFSRTNAEITPVELLLCVPTNLVLAIAHRRAIDWKLTLPPLLMVLAGDALGVFLLAKVDVTAMKLVFGVVLILLGIEALWRERKQSGDKAAHPALLAVLGVAAGILCGLFSVGALLAAYFARVTKDDETFKGCMCMIFAAENLFRVPAYALTGLLTSQTLLNTAALLPFMAVGLFLGMKFSGKMNVRAMKMVVNVLLVFSGAALLMTNL